MRRSLSQEPGFTIVELLVAGLILVIGVCGTLTLVVGANEAVVSAKQREGATNLAREILEQTRRFSFSSLDDATVDAKLQALPGLANVGPPPAYQVTRRGVRYTIDTAVCSIDDAGDGYGAAGTGRCSSTPAGTADADPVDFKRITVTTTTNPTGRASTVRQTAIIGSRGGAEVPILSNLRITVPTGLDPDAPTISDPAVTTTTWRVTASENTTSVVFTVDGTDVGTATKVAGTNDWTYELAITALPDGPSAIGARGLNASDVHGPTTSKTLTLVRGAAEPPRDVAGGPNRVAVSGALQDVAEVEWLPSRSPNVIGYRVYRPDGTLACPGSTATLELSLACMDFSPAIGRYEVASVYRKADGTFGESTRVPTGTLDPGLRTLYPRNTTANTGSGCTTGANTTLQDLVEGWTGNTNSTALTPSNGQTTRFCSTLGGNPIQAGTARAYLYITHGHPAQSCSLDVALEAGGSSTFSGGTQRLTIRDSDPRERVVSFPVSARSLTSSERLSLRLTGASNRCSDTRVHYAGVRDGSSAGQRARLEVPSAYWQPPAPTGLASTRSTDGSVQLTWSQPASVGGTLQFFRIYRDGSNYANRYDRTGDATPGYTDPNRDGGTHTYYVTAVSDDLGESLIAGPVTG